jgi:hypothetical protein
MAFKKIIFFILLAVSVHASANEKCAEAMGRMVVGKVTMECLHVTGDTRFDGTTIRHKLTVIGAFDAKSAKLSDLEVTGNVVLHNSHISGVTHITGALQAFDTYFGGKIDLTAQLVRLSHVTTHMIRIDSNKPAELDLDNTIVNGDIVFSHPGGIVKNHKSQIHGKIMGGK